jgi:hypothetical protein
VFNAAYSTAATGGYIMMSYVTSLSGIVISIPMFNVQVLLAVARHKF